MSDSDGLASFLRARLSEDEAAAREAADGDSGHWFMGDKWNVYRAEDEAQFDEAHQDDEHRLVVYGNVKPQSEHIARHDPERVLRDAKAKRAILDQLVIAQPFLADADPAYVDALNWNLRQLAAVYRDHPGYRQEWAPA